jgi:hypothetical protein
MARWNPDPTANEPAPVMLASVAPASRALVPAAPRTNAAISAVRVVEAVPERAGPGAITGFARHSEPIAYVQAEPAAMRPAAGAGALWSR